MNYLNQSYYYMFRPDLFCLSGNQEQTSCLIANSNSSLTVKGEFRTESDTCYLE